MPKKGTNVSGSIVRSDRNYVHGSDMDQDHSQALERRNTRGNSKRLCADEQPGGEDEEDDCAEAGILFMQLSKVAKRIHEAI